MNILYVFLGSGLGGALRWWISSLLNGNHPWGTLTVNVFGCLCIGLINGLLSRYNIGNEPIRFLLVAGFCGGFTTFSTFINEEFLMLRAQELFVALAYMLLSLSLGLLAVWAGHQLSLLIVPGPCGH